MIIKLYPTNLLWLNFIQNIFNYSWYLGWIFDLQFSYIIWKYFLTSPHLYYCSYVLIPSRKIFGHFLIKLYTECGEWSEWSFRELQKKYVLSGFRKIALNFSLAPLTLINYSNQKYSYWFSPLMIYYLLQELLKHST